MRERIKKISLFIFIILLIVVGWFVWPRLPIITAFAAKGMCSSVFLANKNPERIEAEDLSFFPINLAKSVIDYKERSVTSTVFGLAKRTAVFREDLGAVIVLEVPENELKKQSVTLPLPSFSQDTLPWPKGNIISDSMPEGVNFTSLYELLDTCIDKPGSTPYKKTLGIAIVYDNQLIAERYMDGYNHNTMFHGWSMTKSITGALAGILFDEGKLTLDAPAGFEEWEHDERKNISVKNILQMSSGIEWYENYFTLSDATEMLMQQDNMLESILDNELEFSPGTNWKYSSGDANLLSGILRKQIQNDRDYHEFIYSRLLHPIGMLHTKVETDASGLFVASSYSYGSTRDWARFGMLFLNDGIFAGDTILSGEWVNFLRTPAPVSDGYYGGTFWMKESNPERALVDVPEDVFFADGFLGQRVYIIPSKKLVVVRMGYGLSNFDFNNFLSGIIKCLPGS